MRPSIAHFYYHPEATSYDFGPQHPLRPERLRRTLKLLAAFADVPLVDGGLAEVDDVLRVHDEGYVRMIRDLSAGDRFPASEIARYGFTSHDTPPFIGMWEAACAYCGSGVAAARAIVAGEQLAFNIAGGLHHAQKKSASGFCILNDAAVSIRILREKFERVAYVDIDVHHGDGVEAIFADDETVLTCSIHQKTPGFYPGTGRAEETGVRGTTINVPVAAHTTGDTWLWAFANGIMPALHLFRPQAIVLQMGTDTHTADPLARIHNSAQEWLEAVRMIQAMGVPLLAIGGGGYNLTTVPRMWTAAILTLGGVPFPNEIPAELQNELQVETFFDAQLPGPRNQGREEAERAIHVLEQLAFPAMQSTF